MTATPKDDEAIRIVQFGRSWFSAYTRRGKYLAIGRTKREALENARA